MFHFCFHSLAALILFYVSVVHSSTNDISFGNQILRDNDYEDLIGERVGILSNPSGVFPDSLEHIVDSMVKHPDNSNLWSLVAIFSPEHGFRGEKQAETGDPDVYIDQATGLPVYSAYSLTEEELSAIFIKQNITMLLVDMQDVGIRLYTFIWTMYDMMNATRIASASGSGHFMKFLVLDRPNPLGGDLVEGPLIDMECCASGYGKVPITHIHGLTIGELGLFFYDQYLSNNAKRELFQMDDVVHANNITLLYNTFDTGGYVYMNKRMEGYSRSYKWSDMMIRRGGSEQHAFALPWVPPSPNIPTPTTALAYPSTCFLEATTVAEGRGTNTPFELIGAPFILDPNELAAYINFYCLQGECDASTTQVCSNCARATYFQPTFSKYNNTVVPGIQWLSPQKFNYELPHTGTFSDSKPFLTATTILRAFMQLSTPASAFQWDGSWFGHPGVELIDSYAGTPKYREMLNNFSYSSVDIDNYFKSDAVQFSETRKRYLLYV